MVALIANDVAAADDFVDRYADDARAVLAREANAIRDYGGFRVDDPSEENDRRVVAACRTLQLLSGRTPTADPAAWGAAV
jgi:hypothetical protein